MTTAVDAPTKRVRPEQVRPFEPDAFYSLAAVARACGVAPKTLHNRRASGASSPRATRVAGRLLFRGRDLTHWLAGTDAEPGPPRRRPPNRLDADDVAAIRAGLDSGETKVALARRFGVTPTAIYHVAVGRTWKTVP